MHEETLIKTVDRLMNPPKGILAIDESLKTCNSRFERLGIPTTEEARRAYRELLITAPGIENYISGYILFDETIRQSASNGESFVSILKSKGIDIGIKVDEGLLDFPGHPGEKITDGLQGLAGRLKEYKKLGATFAKWRAVHTIGEKTPSEACMKKNAEIFAEYAFMCQAEDLVPIVEPEVLWEGDHTIEKCYAVTARNLDVIFAELKERKVFIPGIILKTSMVMPGKNVEILINDREIAGDTVKCLKEHVPGDIGGIVFLSGGQSNEAATRHLNNMHKLGPLPWDLSFSYGRAIQNPALQSFAQNPTDVMTAQHLLVERAKANALANLGEYKE